MIGSIGFKVIKKRTQTNTLKWSIPFILNEGSDMFGFIKAFFRRKKIKRWVKKGSTSWDLSSLKLNNDDVTLLVEALKEDDKVKSLDLFDNDIGYECKKVLKNLSQVKGDQLKIYGT